MSAHKSSLWCVAKKCNNVLKKRHFFMFPKEYDRWLQWIHACGRLDLKVMGPEYAHRNYRLCHLHFEEKWYRVGKIRAYLYPDAIPTIFFKRKTILGTTVSEEYIKSTEEKYNVIDEVKRKTENEIEKYHQQEETNRSTSSMYSTTLKETPQKKKLIERNLKLRANRMLGERIRQLQKKIENLENKKTTKNETTKDN